jgi:hypothetical protein
VATNCSKPTLTISKAVSVRVTSARQNGFVYGLVTVFMALMTGWMASIVFRKD